MDPLITLFLSLLAAHLLADFVFQTGPDVQSKEKPLVFAKHIGLVTILSWVLAGEWGNWLIPVVIGVSHTLFDGAKLAGLRRGWNETRLFVWDQTAHVLVILLLVAGTSYRGDYTNTLQRSLGDLYPTTLLLIAGLILAIPVGGIVIGRASAGFLEQIKKRSASAESGVNTEHPREGLSNGGKVIGQLERALIFFFVLVGKPEAVAFLVAAKSIFRFGELTRHSRKEAEYILIGTLMSFGWGLVIAWFTRHLLDHLVLNV